MASRIPQNFIDELLDRTDIVEVVDRRVALKKSGRNYSACCPFHDEKTPSFTVSQEKQFYYCFGCGAGGNAIGFLMDYERLDFPRAIEVLADAAGLDVPREASAFREEAPQKRNIYSLLEKAADYYCQQLRQHPQRQRAVDYLRERGLSGAIAKHFAIGYAPPGWDNLLNNLCQSDLDRQLLIDAGMLVDKPEESKCYDRFRDRIIFPIHDSRGRVIAFGGRVLGDDKPKYLNSPETAVFHKGRELYGLYQARKASRKLERLLIVEGYMDVVALAQHGISWAAATLGTATSTEHLKRVFRLCPEVIFCFDGDDAGRRAAERALEAVLPEMHDGCQARFLFLPQGEDPDSLVRRIGADAFERLMRKASPLEDYLFDANGADLDPDSLDGKAKLSKRCAPLIQQLPGGVFQELMLDRLAQRSGLSRDKLNQLLAQLPAAEPPKTDTPQATAHDTQARGRQRERRALPPEQQLSKNQVIRQPVLYAIALLLHHPRAASHIQLPERLHRADHEHMPLLLAMVELLHKRPESTTAMLTGHWHGEPWDETLQALLHLESFIPEEGVELELADTIAHIESKLIAQEQQHQLQSLLHKPADQLSGADKELIRQLLAKRSQQP